MATSADFTLPTRDELDVKTTSSAKGFTLIEIMVTLVIFSILLALGLPAVNQWMTDSRVRSQAESVLSGLQLARGEAIKNNTIVRFQLVSTMTNACAVAANSNLWVVSRGDPAGICNRNPANFSLRDNGDPYSPTLTADANEADVDGDGVAGPAVDLNGDGDTGDNLLAGTVLSMIYVKGERERATTATTTLGITAAGVGTPDSVVCFTGSGQLARYLRANGQCSASRNPGLTSAGVVQIDVTDPTVAAGCISGNVGAVRCMRILVSPSGDIRMCDPAATDPNDPRRCV